MYNKNSQCNVRPGTLYRMQISLTQKRKTRVPPEDPHLPISSLPTEAQGASIALKSSPGQGATFELCYPAHPVNALPPTATHR